MATPVVLLGAGQVGRALIKQIAGAVFVAVFCFVFFWLVLSVLLVFLVLLMVGVGV